MDELILAPQWVYSKTLNRCTDERSRHILRQLAVINLAIPGKYLAFRALMSID
jgi:hypothetical protein